MNAGRREITRKPPLQEQISDLNSLVASLLLLYASFLS